LENIYTRNGVYLGLLSVLWIHGIEYALIMFIILFLVAFSRVILKAHSVAQVTIGSILGLTLTFIQIHLLFL
jgi:PAP2 superfamily.